MILCKRKNKDNTCSEDGSCGESQTLSVCTLSIMQLQEEAVYKCENYMLRSKGLAGSSTKCVDEKCRKLMASWTFKVVDRCGFSDDTAAIAVNLLDRYLSTRDGLSALKERDIFQLASMTCLYIAVKLHEAETFQSETIQSLSQGVYTTEEVERMELSILFAIQWRCNPPTPLVFVKHFLERHTPLGEKDRRWLFDLTKIQIKLAIIEYGFIYNKASSIALAAIANAVELHQFDISYLGNLGNILNRVGENVRILRRRIQNEVQAKYPNTTSKSIPHKVVKTREKESTGKSFDRVGVNSPREVCF